MAVALTVNGVDKTTDIQHRSLKWDDNLTNRVNQLSFSIIGQSLPFTVSLNDQVVLSIDGSNVFGGRVVSFQDEVEASTLKTRRVKCKDYTSDMDNFYYTATFDTITPLYNLVRDLTHTINKRTEVQIAEFETDETWTGGAADTVNFRRGSQSRKVTSTGSYATSVHTLVSAVDLTNQENITFDIFIDDATVCAGVRIRLGDVGLSNYFEHEITTGFVTGYTQVRVARSAFVSSGSPDWSVIAEAQVATDATGADTVNVSFDDMYSIADNSFTMDNVDVQGNEVASVKFGFRFPSDVMKRYSQVTGLDWYVDSNRDLHMFASLNNTAPFELNDDDGNHIYDSLRIDQDITKLRNVVYIFGGESVATNDTVEELDYQADGTQDNFQLGRRYDLTTVTLEVNSVAQDVGVEGEDQFADGFDALYNVDDKTIFFDTAPGNGVSVNWTGKILFPLVAKITDAASIAEFGEKEITIKEDDLKTFESAIQRAIVEFNDYAAANIDGGFQTDSQGLRAGQRIHLDLDKRGIDDWYIIQKVTGRMRTPTQMTFTVGLVSTKQFSLLHIMQLLLADRMKGIEDFQSEHLVDGVSELVEVSEIIEASTGTEIEEEVESSDTYDHWLQTSGEGGDPLTYVVGNYEPSSNTDTTRTPCADGGAVLAT
jgi:hypothetical protein